jgi:ferredoxin/flavodoxin---NADP+ reductase
MTVDKPCHVVAIVGGACSGSVVAERLAEQGCQVVIFDQNVRPYGKIEDGLPRWHQAQRRLEYGKIDARLDRPEVHYVPKTRLGVDLDFEQLATEWGWSALVLANGAWKDRELAAPGAADVVDSGLVYQNALLYWFNHKNEGLYNGPVFEIQPGTVVVGGGLASIDVIKIVQLELYERALRARGIDDIDMHEMEHAGIPKYCASKGIDDPASLGVEPGILLYRRRVEDMPLASAPKGAKQKVIDRIPMVRKKILDKCLKKFLFVFEPQRLTKEITIEDGHLTGLVLYKTEIEGRNVTTIEGSEHELRTSLVISSIGSVPEAIAGLKMKGAYYTFKDWDTGEYDGVPGVFGAGNVVTGQGNIKASVEHGRFVAQHIAERYLGIADDGERDAGAAANAGEAGGEKAASAVAAHLGTKDPLSVDAVNALLERVAARQREVNFDGDYKAWLSKVSPPDME